MKRLGAWLDAIVRVVKGKRKYTAEEVTAKLELQRSLLSGLAAGQGMVRAAAWLASPGPAGINHMVLVQDSSQSGIGVRGEPLSRAIAEDLRIVRCSRCGLPASRTGALFPYENRDPLCPQHAASGVIAPDPYTGPRGLKILDGGKMQGKRTG